jgi:hypothetical protein
MFTTFAGLKRLYGKVSAAEWASCDLEDLSDLTEEELSNLTDLED